MFSLQRKKKWKKKVFQMTNAYLASPKAPASPLMGVWSSSSNIQWSWRGSRLSCKHTYTHHIHSILLITSCPAPFLPSFPGLLLISVCGIQVTLPSLLLISVCGIQVTLPGLLLISVCGIQVTLPGLLLISVCGIQVILPGQGYVS